MTKYPKLWKLVRATAEAELNLRAKLTQVIDEVARMDKPEQPLPEKKRRFFVPD